MSLCSSAVLVGSQQLQTGSTGLRDVPREYGVIRKTVRRGDGWVGRESRGYQRGSLVLKTAVHNL